MNKHDLNDFLDPELVEKINNLVEKIRAEREKAKERFKIVK